jgi:hypothetical protein
MMERLKRTLVQSYVATIALGWLLAQTVSHFVNIFAVAVAIWLSQRANRATTGQNTITQLFAAQDVLPELIRFGLLLIIWYLLMRWLYFTPIRARSPEPE